MTSHDKNNFSGIIKLKGNKIYDFKYYNGILSVFCYTKIGAEYKNKIASLKEKRIVKVDNDYEESYFAFIPVTNSIIIFNMQKDPSGFLPPWKKEVNSYIYYKNMDKIYPINKLRISSEEISRFGAEGVIGSKESFEKKTIIDLTCYNKKNSFEFNCNNNKVKAKLLTKHIWNTNKTTKTFHPITLSSNLEVEFDETINFENIFNYQNSIRRLLQLIFYRKNIIHEKIEIFSKENEKSIGNIYLNYGNKSKEKLSNKEKLISFKLLEPQINNLMDRIADNQKIISLYHIPENNEKKNIYDDNRFFNMLIGFESIYDIGFSNEFKELKIKEEEKKAKKIVIEFIEKELDRKEGSENYYTGKIRKEFKKIKKSMENDINNKSRKLERILLASLKSFSDVLESVKLSQFMVDINKIDKSNFKKISEKISTLRNKIGHGNLNFLINHEDFVYIQIIELLLYAMLLRLAGYSDEEVIQITQILFT